MAILVSKSNKNIDFETAWHETACRELIELVKPNHKSFLWYRPDIAAEGSLNLQPDFLLYSPWLGLLVLEARDWPVLALSGFTEKEIRLESEGRTGIAAHPLWLARVMASSVQDRISRCPGLQAYAGVALTEISRDDFVFHGMPAAFGGIHSLLFADDIGPKGRLTRDRSGNALKRALCRMFQPMPVSVGLTAEILAETLKVS